MPGRGAGARRRARYAEEQKRVLLWLCWVSDGLFRRLCAVHWPAGSLSLSLSFYTAQEVLNLALPFLPDSSAAGLWHVAGSQTMVVTGGWSGPFRHKVTEVLDSSCGTWRQPPQAEIGARLLMIVLSVVGWLVLLVLGSERGCAGGKPLGGVMLALK